LCNLLVVIGKYNRIKFTNVTLKRLTKNRLEQLKNKIALRSITKLNCSVDEVVSFLMDFYEQNSKKEYPTKEKFLEVTSFSNIKLKKNVPLKDVEKKFDKKTLTVYTIED